MSVPPKDDMFKIHQRLFRVVENLLATGYMTEEDADGYIRHNVLPMHIHKNKDDHWKAIHLLVDALDAAAKRAAESNRTEGELHEPAQTESGLPVFAEGKLSLRPVPKTIVGQERPVPLAIPKEDPAEGEVAETPETP